MQTRSIEKVNQVDGVERSVGRGFLAPVPCAAGAARYALPVLARRLLAVMWCAASLSCSGGSGAGAKYIGAAVTAAAGVAMAGAYRATTGGCWASCRPGTECDEASGTCVEIPCRNRCPAEFRCVRVGGAYECVRGARETASGEPPQGEPAPDEPSPGEPQNEPDPCKGLCLSGEQCVVKAGVADCVPAPAAQDH
jgi:hypothetical protein